MKKTLFYLPIVFLSTLLIYRIAYSEDLQLGYDFSRQDTSEIGDFNSIKWHDVNTAVSTHHTDSKIQSGNYFLSMDFASLKREVEMEVIYKNAYENPTSPNVVAVFKMVLNEFDYLKGLKSFWDGVETKVEEYRRKYKLKGAR